MADDGRATIVVVSIALVFAALFAGFVPGEMETASGSTVQCGAPWSPDVDTEGCVETLAARGTAAWLATGLGGVALVGVMLLSVAAKMREAEAKAVAAKSSRS